MRDIKELAVRILTASIVIGPLLLIGASPAAVAQSVSSHPPVQMATGSAPTADRDTYTQKARDEVREWQRKLDDFSEQAKARGQKEGSAAEVELNAAWTKTEAEGQKLQTATAEEWASAKVSFEQASHELADAWDKVRPGDK
jgi:hypothetical protein